MNDKTSTIQELKNLVEKFRTERNWGKHHSPKNLAVSIAIEAAELLEHFQWDNYREENKKDLESELADIIVYCLFFAISNKIDVTKAVEKKVEHIAKKYPVSILNNKKDDPKDYWQIKKNYRNKKT
jgi:NTP pyrophosphatase (non-canonical NTP hydrolase)